MDLALNKIIDSLNDFLQFLMQIIEARCRAKLIEAYSNARDSLLLLGVLANTAREYRRRGLLLGSGCICIYGRERVLLLLRS